MFNGTQTRVRQTFVLLVGLLLLSSCGSSRDSARTDSSAPSAASSGDYPCGPIETDCTPAEVIATVEILYIRAGATSAEASCLAPVTGSTAHAVNEAFDAPTADQMTAAIECVGSEDRLRQIAEGMAGIFDGMASDLATDIASDLATDTSS